MSHGQHRTPPFGVIFDMDGVLIDSADAHWESWRQLADENSVSVSREQFNSTFGRPSVDIIPVLFGEVTSTKTQLLSNRKESIYRNFIADHPPIVDGAVELIRSLHAAGVALALGSSGPRENIDLVLGAMQVAEFLPVIVSAEEVTRGKPDPQVFQISARRLGLAPDRCIVIEDAPAGVQAAKAAGAGAVAVLMYHPRQSFMEADLIVDSLTDLSARRLSVLIAS